MSPYRRPLSRHPASPMGGPARPTGFFDRAGICKIVRPSQKKTAPPSQEEKAREEKEMRENLTEKEIDKTLEDSFPASDPPAWY
jgi:hypothetical protein